MQFNSFDIHSHLNFKDYDADREEVIKKMQEEGIGTITVGTDLKTSQEAVELAEKYENLFACIGLHPADNTQESFDEKEYEKLVKHPKVVAVGECGLDYAFERRNNIDGVEIDVEKEKNRQKDEFDKQIAFAVKYDKPLMIHCRDAYPDALEMLRSKKTEYGEKLRGNFHFFTSPIEIAQQCFDIGFTVSFTGPITFAKQYEELVRYVPLEKIMVETDSPYASPAPYRGKRNNPLYVQEIIKKIAEIKGIDLDMVQKTLMNNVLHFFFNKS